MTEPNQPVDCKFPKPLFGKNSPKFDHLSTTNLKNRLVDRKSLNTAQWRK